MDENKKYFFILLKYKKKKLWINIMTISWLNILNTWLSHILNLQLKKKGQKNGCSHKGIWMQILNWEFLRLGGPN